MILSKFVTLGKKTAQNAPRYYTLALLFLAASSALPRSCRLFLPTTLLLLVVDGRLPK